MFIHFIPFPVHSFIHFIVLHPFGRLMEEQLKSHLAMTEAKQNEISASQKNIRALKLLVEEKASEITDLQENKSDMEMKASAAEARCIVLNESLEDSKEQIKSLKTIIASVQDKGKESIDLAATLNQVRADLELKSKQLDSRTHVIDDLTCQLTREKHVSKKLKVDLRNCSEDHNRLRDKFSSTESILQKYKARLQDSKTFTSGINDRTDKIISINSSITAATDDFDKALQMTIKSLSEQLQQFISTQQHAVTDIKLGLSSQIQEVQSMVDRDNEMEAQQIEREEQHRLMEEETSRLQLHGEAFLPTEENEKNGKFDEEEEENFGMTQMASDTNANGNHADVPFFDRSPMVAAVAEDADKSQNQPDEST